MTMFTFDSTTRPARIPAPRLAIPAIVVGLVRRVGEALAVCWAIRTAGAYDDAFLKDIGVPRCGLEHAVRRGRSNL